MHLSIKAIQTIHTVICIFINMEWIRIIGNAAILLQGDNSKAHHFVVYKTYRTSAIENGLQ